MHEHEIERRIEGIANRVLAIPTLSQRGSDSLDFHDVSVWALREALLAAYHAGREAGPLPRTAPCPRCGAEVAVRQITTT